MSSIQRTSNGARATVPKKNTRAEEKLKAFHEESTLGKTYDLRLIKMLWVYVRPHSKLVALSLATLVIMTIAGLVRPLVMGSIARHASEQNSAELMRDGLVLGGLLVVVQALTFAQFYSMQLAGARAMADLRAAVFAHMQRLSLRYFDRTPVGRLVTRATNDVDGLGELFASGVLNAIGDLLLLVGIVAMMLALDWKLSIIAFMALPLVGFLVNAIRKRSREAYRAIRVRTARLNAFLNEQVNGIAVVQAFGRERSMAAEFDDINIAYRDANKNAVLYEAFLDAAIEMVSTLCVASVLWWAGAEHAMRRLGDEHVSFALVVTFTQYIKQFFEPISMLSQRYTVLQSAMSGAERIFELMDEKDLEPDARILPNGAGEAALASPSPARPNEALALEHVTFEYKPGSPVLRDVSLSANTGERIALVGATGAGKTTVASLLLRLYESTAGEIRVLGRDVRSYSPTDLRNHFAVVPQDVFLFAGTVLSNVALSDKTPSRSKVEDALARVGALDLFLRRDGGLDAHVDERGSNFSAGERQLLAFARAVYKDAPLLVLDEATASVDSDTEARLQVALEAVIRGRTALVIAHRLSTIRAADRIVVFHKGRVVEVGTHDELLARAGVYARLYRLQFAHERIQHEGAGGPESLAPPASVGATG
jgi:ATP-binding cassette, subfamily B, multidrug efflux pump